MAREPVSFDFVHQYEGGHRSRPVAEDVDPTHERRAADRVARADRDPTEAEVVISLFGTLFALGRLRRFGLGWPSLAGVVRTRIGRRRIAVGRFGLGRLLDRKSVV